MDEITYQKLLEKPSEKYEVKDQWLYRRKKRKSLKVPHRYELEDIFYQNHDHPLSAHFGAKVTYEKVVKQYWWPNMRKDVEEYVRSCDKCQRRGKSKNKHELHPISVEEPFERIGIDLVGPLPRTKEGKRYIAVAVDYLTKWPEARALGEATANEVSKFIYEEIICRHGSPKKILTDRGSHFNNQIVRELMDKYLIKHNLSTPYHPKTNGLVERFNRTLCEALAKLTEDEEWDEKISSVLYAYRTKRQESTKIEPFRIVYGRRPTNLINGGNESEEEDIEEIRNETRRNIKETQRKTKEKHDQKIKMKEFNLGEKVLYYNAAKEKQWTGKLEDKWKGPYYIQEKLFNGAYRLKELDGKIMKTPVNGELLKKYFSRENFIPYIVV